MDQTTRLWFWNRLGKAWACKAGQGQAGHMDQTSFGIGCQFWNRPGKTGPGRPGTASLGKPGQSRSRLRAKPHRPVLESGRQGQARLGKTRHARPGKAEQATLTRLVLESGLSFGIGWGRPRGHARPGQAEQGWAGQRCRQSQARQPSRFCVDVRFGNVPHWNRNSELWNRTS